MYLFLSFSKFLFSINCLYFLIPYLLTIFICYKIYKSWRIYSYSYSTEFPILIIKNKYKRNNNTLYSLFHTKLYIIDDKYAYTGSINFTKKGFEYNYETRIKIDDKNTILELSSFFDCLYNKKWAKRNIEYLGGKIYKEPIN